MRERDLFRAIVLSGAALTAAPGCSSEPAVADAGTDAPIAPVDTGAEVDTGVLVADAGPPEDVGTLGDAGLDDAGEDAMVLIL